VTTELLKKNVAQSLYEIGAFKDKTKSPGGQGFRLKLHQSQPSAPLSPFYIDLRIIRSFPIVMRWVVSLYVELVRDLQFDLVADIPTAATPIVTLMSQQMVVPMITPREPKGHGTQSNIDGVFAAGQTVLVVDDLITAADSKIATAQVLEMHNLVVHDMAVLIDRQQGGKEKLAAANYRLHAGFELVRLLEIYRQGGQISPELDREIRKYVGLA
jgi:uridine monophosphate synthetase